MTNTKNLSTQHLIIGFGKAGKSLAQSLAKAGEHVTLVEQSSHMYGGTCINIGCIPSKKLAFLAYERAKLTSLNQAIEQKNQLINKLNQDNYHKIADLENVEVITGKASFIDNHTVQVITNNKTLTITAESIYINTGAYNWQPPIDGLKDSKIVYDSTSIMQLTVLPKQLVVIGGGYIGLEFAFIFAGFGSQVTILETSDSFLPREDEDIVMALRKIMKKNNINIGLNQKN